MKKLKILLLVFSCWLLAQCTIAPKRYSQNCITWAATGNLAAIRANWNQCKNARAQNGTTMMMAAAAHNLNGVLDYLLSAGETLDAFDDHGDTALHYAISRDQKASVYWLIDHGASQKSFRADKISPLMIALQHGQSEIVEFLLSKPFEVNAQMEDGWTVLHYAARRKDPGILRRILDLGGDPRIKGKDEETALDLANEEAWAEGVRILHSAMTNPLSEKVEKH